MQPAESNENGIIEARRREVVAHHGRAYAEIAFALCADGLYRFGLELRYGHGGLGFPIRFDSEGYASLDPARTAGLEQLLRAWHKPFPSDPVSVRAELSVMRDQVESRVKQPSLF